MTPKKQTFKPEYAHTLLRIAFGDLESAEGMFESKKGRIENVLFMCQQAIEKALKSFLCFRGDAIVMTHDIEVLLTLIGSRFAVPHADVIVSFTDYAMLRRYIEGEEVTPDQTILDCLGVTRNVLDAIRVHLANPSKSQ